MRSLRAFAQRHPFVSDAYLAGALLVAGLVSGAAVTTDLEVALLTAATTLPLALRRRFPLSVLTLVTMARFVGSGLVDTPEVAVGYVALAIAAYSAAAYGAPSRHTWFLPLWLVAITGGFARELWFDGDGAADQSWLALAFRLAYDVALLAVPWLSGSAVGRLRERERSLAERTVELDAQRDENARQAVFAERVRIARELHDVVAHHVSVMGVQAGAARLVMDSRPDQAAEALGAIELSSRQAVTELQKLLGFLRRGDEGQELAPQPRLADLRTLVTPDMQGELAVSLAIEGVERPLPAMIEVSAYRIVQEALTNARKHSGGRHATVRVRYGDHRLDVEVVDEGVSTIRYVPEAEPAAPRTRGGHGMIGMRERVALHGGELYTGPDSGGGFAVKASFPLDGMAS